MGSGENVEVDLGKLGVEGEEKEKEKGKMIKV